MHKKLKAIALGLLLGLGGLCLVGTMVTRNLATEGTYTYLKLFNEVLSLVRNSYVDEVETDRLLQGAYDGMLAELDPFSEYLTPQEYADYAATQAKGAKAGGGPDAGLRLAKKEGIVLVVSVRSGSDAEAKGITPGDQIRRINGRFTREMSLHEIETRLAGPAGSSAAVSVARREEPRKIDTDLLFDEPRAEAVSLQPVDPKDGVAVLRIPHFRPGAAAEVALALERAEKQRARRLLIDLRGNAWGTIQEAARSAGVFIGDTTVAKLKSKQETVEEIKGGRSSVAFSGTLGLLINGATAEAAELFTAAVHDAKNAPVFGETSFGVGAQQELIPLRNGGYLKLSVRQYVSPGGSPWHGSGLKPDKTVAASFEIPKQSDRLKQQLKQAIEQFRTYEPPATRADRGTQRNAGGA